MLKVKMDLGSEAVILNTRKVRKKGVLHIFSKPLVEVLAAVDEQYSKDNLAAGMRKNEEKNLSINEEKQNNFIKKEEKISELENRLNKIENLLMGICDKVEASSAAKITEQDDESAGAHIKLLRIILNNLKKNNVEEELAEKIVEEVKKKVRQDADVNDTVVALREVIMNMLGKSETIKLREDNKTTVVMLVGPTGVGKTTTLAKIAADYALNKKKKVGFITADTYRIAAVEQLKTYAEILGIPLTVIYSPQEAKAAIEGHMDKDLVLIDTAGRSCKNKEQLEELNELIKQAEPDEIYLLVSANTSLSDCKLIYKTYNFLKDYKIIITKVDESETLGIALNLRNISGKSLSYMTTGQSVPDDIEQADMGQIAKKLLGSIN